MTRNLLPTLVILVAIGLFFFVLDGQFVRLMGLINDRSTVSETQEEFELLQTVRADLAERAEAAEEDYQEMEKFMPSERNDARTMMTVQAAAEAGGVSFESIAVEGGSDDRASGQLDLSEEGVETKTIRLVFNTRLSNFLNFAQELEGSLRQYDMTSISINPQEAGIHEFTVGIQAYWTD